MLLGFGPWRCLSYIVSSTSRRPKRLCSQARCSSVCTRTRSNIGNTTSEAMIRFGAKSGPTCVAMVSFAITHCCKIGTLAEAGASTSKSRPLCRLELFVGFGRVPKVEVRYRIPERDGRDSACNFGQGFLGPWLLTSPCLPVVRTPIQFHLLMVGPQSLSTSEWLGNVLADVLQSAPVEHERQDVLQVRRHWYRHPILEERGCGRAVDEHDPKDVGELVLILASSSGGQRVASVHDHS